MLDIERVFVWHRVDYVVYCFVSTMCCDYSYVNLVRVGVRIVVVVVCGVVTVPVVGRVVVVDQTWKSCYFVDDIVNHFRWILGFCKV